MQVIYHIVTYQQRWGPSHREPPGLGQNSHAWNLELRKQFAERKRTPFSESMCMHPSWPVCLHSDQQCAALSARIVPSLPTHSVTHAHTGIHIILLTCMCSHRQYVDAGGHKFADMCQCRQAVGICWWAHTCTFSNMCAFRQHVHITEKQQICQQVHDSEASSWAIHLTVN